MPPLGLPLDGAAAVDAAQQAIEAYLRRLPGFTPQGAEQRTELDRLQTMYVTAVRAAQAREGGGDPVAA